MRTKRLKFKGESNIKALVTGASGFVGANLTRELVRQGYKVYAIVRDESKFRSILGGEHAGSVTVLKGDLLDDSHLENLKSQLTKLEDIDVVVQTVGGGPLTSNRSLAPGIYDLNLKTTTNLIRILEDSQKLTSTRLFLYFSSLAAMGMPEANEARIHYDETSACNPVLPYERAKFETETFLKDFSAQRGLKTVALRFPQIYGGTDDAFLQMVRFIRKGTLPMVRGRVGSLPLIHIRDVVGATCAVLRNSETIPNAFSVYLVSEGSYSYDQIVTLVRKKCAQGRALKLPYSLMYVGVSMVEGVFGLINKPEPLNRRRLVSLTKDRVVDSTKFMDAFQFKFEENVERYVASQVL